MKTLKDKVVLVTGASRGIGRAIALSYAREGARLIVSGRNQADLEALAEEIRGLDTACEVIPTDLREPEEVENLAERSQTAFGQVDILVNNAGVGSWAPVSQLTLEQYNDMFNVNVRAVFLLTRAILPGMIARGMGHIINIASTSSRWTYPEGTVYCASKFAVLGFNEALAKEVRETGVSVTAICPGQVNTYLGDSGPEDWTEGMLEPEDVADVVIQVSTLPSRAIVTELVIWPRSEEF